MRKKMKKAEKRQLNGPLRLSHKNMEGLPNPHLSGKGAACVMGVMRE
jgi:hypothetical protein